MIPKKKKNRSTNFRALRLSKHKCFIGFFIRDSSGTIIKQINTGDILTYDEFKKLDEEDQKRFDKLSEEKKNRSLRTYREKRNRSTLKKEEKSKTNSSSDSYKSDDSFYDMCRNISNSLYNALD